MEALMDIYELLKKEHMEVKKIFKQIENEESPAADRLDEAFLKIRSALTVHMEGEELYFYPRLEQNDSSKADALEALEEHGVAKKLLMEIGQDPKEDVDHRKAKLKVLGEVIDDHVEEEESKLFSRAKKIYGKKEAEEIAGQFMGLKEKSRQPQAAGV
jgi:hemerythrin superfamily protein